MEPGRPLRLLINGLSVGSGGGYTVARELWRHIAVARPAWQVTMALISGHTLHESIRRESAPSNCDLFWAAPEAADRRRRGSFEKTTLADHARKNFDAVLQLNGMIIPGLTLPTLVHHQDPWPYRSEAWNGWKDRVIAFLKRRANAYALKHADCMGWTSGYLRDLVCGDLAIQPKRSEVLYNGLPDDWLDRARSADVNDWAQRPMQLASVSNVNPYKRQDLVIRAMPALLKRPGLGQLKYHIAGHGEAGYLDQLRELARSLGVADAVIIEGRVSDERVTELVGSSRAFTLMSVCESFGIPAVEAMSLGTPVVTSDCCAMPEVCGKAADLVPVDDVNRLVETLAVALTDEAHARENVKLGLQRVQAFAWRDTAERMATVFEEITSPKR
ncbi:MAG: glycosyl transferase, group 1 [Phycisphaerales bacterium]|nr:glycosyl transferase, group 1 [Phycisphaerales bacterium]